MNNLTIARVETDMLTSVEQDHIPHLQIPATHRSTSRQLLVGSSRNRYPHLPVRPLHQTGAIERVRTRGAAAIATSAGLGPVAGGTARKETNSRKRHIAVDVNGLLLAVVVTDASIQDRDAAHRLLAALRVAFSTIRLVWADGGYPGRLLIWAEHVLALRIQIIKRIRGSTGFHVRPCVWVVERTFAWISKHRRCVRD